MAQPASDLRDASRDGMHFQLDGAALWEDCSVAQSIREDT
jgi:hypothetical protein